LGIPASVDQRNLISCSPRKMKVNDLPFKLY